MFMRRLKHMLFRLSAEEKVIGIGGLAVILSVFMPWYSVVLSFEKGVTESGFSGDLGVVGFVVFLITLISLGFLMGDHLHFRLPRFGFGKEGIILFFSAESAFLLLLEIAIFTKRSLDYTNAEIRFGLYMALIGSVLATFAAFAQLQKLQKKEAKSFFEHEPEPMEMEEVTEEPTPEEPIAEEPHVAKARPAKRHQVVNEGGRPVIQELFFEEEKVEQVPEEETIAPLESEILAEETMTMAETSTDTEPAEIEERVEAELESGETPEEKPAAEGQGNYFLRDADIAPSVEIREVEKKEAPSVHASRGTGFYDDL